ncbi:MAG: hypothetical protein A2847_01755 [Candidatus Sungbacteria bacterium RIFCSPHIGHO2_01_FULL_50_25]|uniref:MBL fold hydrolase n=1 Tax=Candidatus Sungbacteria bacterium RIFCSPHIGHO2_01_FULL_50_25 TaxID=1802265 RepID=A0A1G2KBZ1_9BACT|nr:MAG: hypothetical protein A2847_01755 [Candidatus Sungbacteria bacterium RIFCSPHIGHO2_01_FULL_50_25]
MNLSFHGGAREVTGACYLFEAENKKILVDCGLFQGCEECPALNKKPFQFSPSEIDALFVTHAHIDHVGRIPKLVKDGFRGTIYSTAPTRDIARILLEDALTLSEKEGDQIYGEEDIKKAFSLWEDRAYGREFSFGDMRVMFRDAGHILGSAFVDIRAEGKRILFSGDFGNTPSVLLPPPESVQEMDYLVIESTYGNRTHESDEARKISLERAVEDVSARGGVLMIPAFATERAQDLLHLLNEMLAEKRIPDIPVFVDSPLAIKITHVFERYPSYYKDEIRSLYTKHPHLFQFKKLHLAETVDDSKKINDISPPKVVIAGSGMMTGGRILHHLRRYLGDSRNMLVVVGYQAAGSLGRRLLEGEKFVRVLGNGIEVGAEVREINGFSAHADNPQLFSFIERAREHVRRVFVVQGEDDAALHLTQEIRDRLGIKADAPQLFDSVSL